MDVTVRTGSTKSARDCSLVSLSLETLHGEQVCVLMEIVGKERDSKTVERECETVIRHALLEADGTAPERLDGTLKEMNGLLKGMLVSGTVHDVHMLIAVLDNEQMLHVSHAGRAEAYLVRKGIASQITEYSGKPTPAFVHIASGKIEQNDMLIFSSQRLLRTLTPAQLGKLCLAEDGVLESLTRLLETEGEHAALATLRAGTGVLAAVANEDAPRLREDRAVLPARGRRSSQGSIVGRLQGMLPSLATFTSVLPSTQRMRGWGQGIGKKVTSGRASSASARRFFEGFREGFSRFLSDLTDPKRKKRAHLLLLASSLAALIVIWALVHLFTSSQRSKTRAELENLVEQINAEVQTAENRRIIGDTDAANAILQRAEERAKQVMDNESGLFRVEALDLLDRIRSKREEINNITRLSPRVVANLAAKTKDVLAQGIIGLGDGEFVVHDRQDLYRILLNSVEDPNRLSDDVLIVDGAWFSRFQTLVFLMSGNSVMEWASGQAISMKTDDPKGWVNGKAISAYLRFLYVLSPENKQIYKYERLNNRYSAPVEYNVNGDLTGALDMTIDGNVYVLKEGGIIVKLFRGESQSFVIRKAPEGLLKDSTRLYKVTDRNFYVLDPSHARIIVLTDGGPTGESSYLKQYVLEGEQIGELKDLYVDPDETHLYVTDEKRIYVVDLVK